MYRHLTPLLAATLGIVTLPRPARAIEFDIYYTDPDGQGFFDPALGPQRRAAINFAASLVGRTIRPTYLGETYDVRVGSYTDSTVNTLASARPAFFVNNFSSSDPRYQPNTQFAKALGSHLAHSLFNPADDDISMSVNFAQPYYFGTDGIVPPNQYDFISTAAHEILHGLGFYDSFRAQGGFGVNDDGTFTSQTDLSGYPVIYDTFLTVGPNGTPLVTLGSAARAANLTSNNIFWSGTNATTGNGGTPAKINAPNPFSSGSSIGHLDSATYPNDIMSPSLGFQQLTQTLSPVTRGILRDIGWDIGVISTEVAWLPPSNADNRASTYSNWTQSPYPGDSLAFGNNPAGVTDVKMDAQLYSHPQLRFSATAPAYTIRLRSYTDTDLTGFGIRNEGLAAHTFVLETYSDDLSSPGGTHESYIGRAARLNFLNSATASNSIFHVRGGFTNIDSIPNSGSIFLRYSGTSVNFLNNATAQTATFHVAGGSGNGGPNGSVNFYNSATAATATFNNGPGSTGPSLPLNTTIPGFGGQTNFYNSSTASAATFNNLAQTSAPSTGGVGGSAGLTTFHDTSTAAAATFNNFGATIDNALGGATQFTDSSTSATGTFNNHPSPFPAGVGLTSFFGAASAPGGLTPDTATSDAASAGSSTFNNLPGAGFLHAGGATRFHGSSSAGSATLNNLGSTPGTGGYGGVTQFYDNASAASATIRNLHGGAGGRTEFRNASTAANATILLPARTSPGTSAGEVVFLDNASAGSATLSAGAETYATIDFRGSSTAAGAHVTLSPNSSTTVRFWDSATAASATFDIASAGQLHFFANSNAGSADITIRPNGNLSFFGDYNPALAPTSSAANATVRIRGGTASTVWGGAAYFSTYTTAGNATFLVDAAVDPSCRGGSVNFDYEARLGSAVVQLAPASAPNSTGGELYVRRGSTAQGARVITGAGSLADFSGNAFYGGTSLGHIEGAGTVILGGSELRVGYLGLPATLSGPVVSGPGQLGGSLTKVGPATLTLAGPNNYEGPTTVSAGALLLTGSNAKAAPYVVASGASLSFLSPHTVTSLDVDGSVTFAAPLTLAPNSPASSLATFILSAGGSIDLTNNALTLESLSPADTRSLILSGKLLSSTPDPNDTHSLGYLQTPTGTLLKLTLTGDANLDGSLTPDDFALIDRGFLTQGTLWQQGDFNYDGTVNTQDYLLIDRVFLTQAQGFSPGFLSQRESQFGPTYLSTLQASIPEPTTLAPCAALFLPTRRHRRP